MVTLPKGPGKASDPMVEPPPMVTLPKGPKNKNGTVKDEKELKMANSTQEVHEPSKDAGEDDTTAPVNITADPETTQEVTGAAEGVVKKAEHSLPDSLKKVATAEDLENVKTSSGKVEAAMQGIAVDAGKRWNKLKEDLSQRSFPKEIVDELLKELSYAEEALDKGAESGYQNLKEELGFAPGAGPKEMKELLHRADEAHQLSTEIVDSKMQAVKKWLSKDSRLNTVAAAQVTKDLDTTVKAIMTAEHQLWEKLLTELGKSVVPVQEKLQVRLSKALTEVDKAQQEAMEALDSRWSTLRNMPNASDIPIGEAGLQNLQSRTDQVQKGLRKALKEEFLTLKQGFQTLAASLSTDELCHSASSSTTEILAKVHEKQKSMVEAQHAEWETMKKWLLKTPGVTKDKADEFMEQAVAAAKDAMAVAEEGLRKLLAIVDDCTKKAIAPAVLPDVSLADNSQTDSAENEKPVLAPWREDQGANLAELKQASHESAVRRHTFTESMESDAEDEKNLSSRVSLNFLLLLIVSRYGLTRL
mmetsp:Transcript_33543/g.60733  ORF Transcript_33543/g.60733 Transcript_33543/m.60733 type:complete len:530 (-) Transcript_33543:168-1757(-)